MNPSHRVSFEPTPNPQSLKFQLGQTVSPENMEIKKGESTARSPLAKKLFGFPWTEGVFIGADFVTVTKQDWVDWETLAEPLAGLIAEHLELGEPVVISSSPNAKSAEKDLHAAAEDSETVRQIKRILNEEIRPAVAGDGGDVIFQRFEDGIVYVYLQGACSGCPSSTMTLKDGIATRLRASLPEVMDVVSV